MGIAIALVLAILTTWFILATTIIALLFAYDCDNELSVRKKIALGIILWPSVLAVYISKIIVRRKKS